MTDHRHRFLTRRAVLKGTAGGVAAAGLAGCQGDGGDGNGTPADDGTADGDGDGQGAQETTTGGDGGDGGASGRLQFAQLKSPIEFDPIVLNDVPSIEVAQLVFDSLYEYDESTGLVPGIAASEPEIEREAQRWIVELNGDARFQNGDTVTAEDVVYSFTMPLEESTENAGEVNMIDTVEAVDESTVQFDLQFPYAAFDHTLARMVVPKSVREENVEKNDEGSVETNDFADQPIGAGPFEFVDWQEGEHATVQAWDDYWGDVEPQLDEIEFVPVEEGTTRITTLQTEENDVIKGIPPQSWETVEGMDQASIASVPGIGYFYLAFNCNEGPTTDLEVREAIDYAFSMDDAVERYVAPSGTRQYSPIPEAMSQNWNFPFDEWADVPHEQDIDQAKSMLDDNDNVPDDWSARIIVPPDDMREQIGVSVSNALQEAGYDATVQRLDWGAFTEQYQSGSADDFNMYTLGWSGTPDPDSFVYFLFSQETFGTNNGTWYENDEVEEQIITARESNDHEERLELYTDAITTLLEDRVHLPAYNLKNNFGVNQRVQDFHAHPVDQFSIATNHNNVSVE